MAVTISGTDGISGDLPNIKVSNGTEAAPALTGQDTDSGVFFGTNEVNISTNGSTRAKVDSSGRLLIGTTSSTGSHILEVNGGTDNEVIKVESSDAGAYIRFEDDDTTGQTRLGAVDNDLKFDVNSAERLRITSAGKVQVTGTRGGSLQPSDNDTLELFTSASNGAVNTGCGLTFYNNDGNGAEIGGTIQVAKENGSINNTAGYMRFSTRANNSDPSERMRIASGGNVMIGQTNGSYGTSGHIFGAGGQAFHINPGDTVLLLNRQNNDGEIIRLSQDGATEGTISVSGSTVSYNGGHLARWSQLASGAERTEILRGSVLSNLDEMCEWAYEAQDAVLYTEEDDLPEGVSVGDVKTPARDAGTEDNEQLNRMKVSDIEGDPNVSGVFQAWDDDDDTYTNDFYCAMTGDFVIRIAQGTTVARGDLLMSAGDGTAKPQDDDIVRSKTIAKVTSTTVSCTYDDGSYCVPCVLMAC